MAESSRPVYAPLTTPRSTRVIILQKGSFDEEVVCSLKEVSLDENPTFTGLSYVWGDVTKTVQITCGTRPIHVTANLGAALRRLREESEDVTVWADAVCINQMDVEEKSQQVAMMGDIYKAATQVAVYLGEDTENMAGALELLQMFWKLHLKTKGNPARNDIAMMAYQQRESRYQELPPPDDPRYEALVEFLQRPYFTRIWTIQEVCLAASDPIVLCGSRRIPWREIAYAVNLFWSSQIERLSARGTETWAFSIITMQAYRERQEGIGKEEWFSLNHWLLDVKESSCTDPRDRIYGLLGLASDNRGAADDSPFKPDYRLSIEQVYQNTAAGIINQKRNLALLSHAYYKTYASLPSWVPDWTTGNTDLTALTLDYGSDHYNASMGFPVNAHFSSDCKIVHLTGQEIDTVDWCYRPFEAADINNTPELRKPGALRDLWESHIRLLGQQYAGGGTVVEAFWRTLVANTDTLRRPAPDSLYLNFLTFWREMRLWDLAVDQYIQSNGERRQAQGSAESWAKIKEFIETTFWNKDQYAAYRVQTLQRFLDQGMTCTCSGNLRTELQTADGTLHVDYCFLCMLEEMLNDPEKLQQFAARESCPRLQLEDPTENMMDDQFVAEWYRLLRADGGRSFPFREAQWADYLTACLRPMAGRSFFCTSGKLIGLGPPNMRAGDEVVVLAGGNVPFALRPEAPSEGSRQSFRLLGEMYVHGVMDGSALKKDEEGNPRWDEFTLI